MARLHLVAYFLTYLRLATPAATAQVPDLSGVLGQDVGQGGSPPDWGGDSLIVSEQESSSPGSVWARIKTVVLGTPVLRREVPTVTLVTVEDGIFKPNSYKLNLGADKSRVLSDVINLGAASKCDRARKWLGTVKPPSSPEEEAIRDAVGKAICATEEVVRQAKPNGPVNEIATAEGEMDLELEEPYRSGFEAVEELGADAVAAGTEAGKAALLVQIAYSTALIVTSGSVLAGVIAISKTGATAEQPKDQGGSTTTSTTTTSCAFCEVRPTEVEAAFYEINTQCSSATDCPTDQAEKTQFTTFDAIAWTAPPDWLATPTTTSLPPGTTPSDEPQCQGSPPGGIQWDVFGGSDYQVAGQFCDEAVEKKPDEKQGWVVDAAGNKIPNKQARSPPLTPKDYDGYTISLTWEPQLPFDGEKCKENLKCRGAYQYIAASPCGHTDAETRIVASAGTFNVTCGVYSWNITAPQKPVEPEPAGDPEPAPPEPTNAVVIDYMYTDNGAQSVWVVAYMDEAAYKDTDHAYNPVACISGRQWLGGNPGLNVDEPGYPPLDIDVDQANGIPDRKGCKYISVDGGAKPGKFKCDGVDEIECKEHLFAHAPPGTCNMWGADQSWRPRAMCEFPR